MHNSNASLAAEFRDCIECFNAHKVHFVLRVGAEAVELEGQRVLVIGLAELLTNKRAAGRRNDTADLRRLLREI